MSSKRSPLKNESVSHDFPFTGSAKTLRSIERDRENFDFIPVIIKRTDEATRHPDDTLERSIQAGLEQHYKSFFSLILSSMAAGLILGFAAMSVALAYVMFPLEEVGLYANRLATGLVYPLGFVVCIMSGTNLFTEQTATAVYPYLDKQVSLVSLIKLWIITLVGNLAGTFLSSFLMFLANPVIQAEAGFIGISNHLLEHDFGATLISAVLAGWLMAQGGWLIFSTNLGSSQIICIYIVTFIIGIGGLHHSIAGSAEVFGALLFQGGERVFDTFKFLVTTIMGNMIGGSVFVAVLNYAYIRKTQQKRKSRPFFHKR